MKLALPHRVLQLTQPLVMGVLNVTPDSFSDGGRHFSPASAIARAREMQAEGAAFIDVGGESTRPGAQPVSEQQELDRVLPVIEALRREVDCLISIDTMKPVVMRAAVSAGASLINDVNALRAPGALEAAASSGAAVCLMHMQGQPRSMQQAPHYTDVVKDVREFLASRQSACQAAGIAADRICIDPGIGFGKLLPHNLSLLSSLDHFHELGAPLVIGVSRKSLLGQLLDAPVDARLSGSLAVAALAVWQGAAIVRAHDVRPTFEALKVAAVLRDRRRNEHGH